MVRSPVSRIDAPRSLRDKKGAESSSTKNHWGWLKDAGTGVIPSVRIYLPAPVLQPYVTFYYFVDASGPFDDFLYPEWGNVRFGIQGDWAIRMDGHYPDHPQRAALYGPTDRRGDIVTTGGKTIGFGMTPLGWSRLIGGNAATMANKVCELGDTLGPDSDTLVRAFRADPNDAAGVARFDRELTALIERRPPNDFLAIAVDRVVREHPEDVEAFARAVGVSTRTLYRICLRTFGFPPKRLLRRQRFLDTLGQMRRHPDGRIGGLVGYQYCDQSHFIRDFNDFMGMTPRAYLQAPRVLMRQAATAQSEIGIDLTFELPPQPGG